eukprot:6472082-Amphidinium_carterae.4
MMTHLEMTMILLLTIKENRELQFVVESVFSHFNEELPSPFAEFAGRFAGRFSVIIIAYKYFIVCKNQLASSKERAPSEPGGYPYGAATAVFAPKEEMISKHASKVLAKLEVKNHHHMNAIVLKRTWDIWLTQIQQTFNMWSTPAAHHFKNALEQSQERCKDCEELPIEKKLAFEQKYVFGLRSLPLIENLLEGHNIVMCVTPWHKQFLRT